MANWQRIVQKAINLYKTPFYLFYWPEIIDSLTELSLLDNTLPIRHWLSFKTAPVAPLIRLWIASGRSIEVVREYELRAAIKEGCPPEKILVNGVGKWHWLNKFNLPKLNVVFDSLNEVNALIARAKELEWMIGLRVHVSNEYDPDEVQYSTQFGMTLDEIDESIKIVAKSGCSIDLLHFHLRSNVHNPSDYYMAIKEIAELAYKRGINPQVIDCGGGLPVSGERPSGHIGKDPVFELAELRDIFKQISVLIPSVKEIWLENGRFITARAGVLVLRVVDVKQRADSRFLICDGGRTNHALVSDWENHDLFIHPRRHGQLTHTTICGPTCMAYDRLVRDLLPYDIKIGDYVVWKNAGAYHLPWETRFSGGLASVIWCDNEESLTVAREPELFEKWWAQWK